MQTQSLPVNAFYDGRSEFTIIGLTGVTGSGCTQLANIMGSVDFLQNIRKPEDIYIPGRKILNNDEAYGQDALRVNDKAINSFVFKRKYSLCYDFANHNYQPYTIIKYTHIIWLYAILEIYKEKSERLTDKDLKEWIRLILKDKFKPSKVHDSGFKKETGYSEEERDRQIDAVVDSYEEYGNLLTEILKLPYARILDTSNYQQCSYELKEFSKAGSEFDKFLSFLFKKLGTICCYSLCFLHHKMACQIRKKGSLCDTYHDVFRDEENDYSHLYDLVKLLNAVIKGYKREKVGNDSFRKIPSQIVIDSIRNSLEAQYLKERYTAFYLIAVHDERRRQANILAKVHSQMPDACDNVIRNVAERMDDLSLIEADLDDYKVGKFSTPNIEQTVADAEIHIINNRYEDFETDTDRYEFLTMEEQWMKYSSLILHPGLITPSAEERCMVVAYTAKFNSACLSRQVGAVITNQYHSIRTIGWNDVPYGQVPCGLRPLKAIGDGSECNHCVYSEFERSSLSTYHDGGNFKGHVANDYPMIEKQEGSLDGLSFPYCFKTLHNRYEGEANQVFTRSLHAEENAILQMAKYGGQPLMNGVIYVTASPCELCAKKLYQIGVRKIVYIDPYPGISRQQIIKAGFKQPALKQFQGVYGSTYFKLYQPFMSYKDELDIRIGHNHKLHTKGKLLEKILEKLDMAIKNTYTEEEINEIVSQLPDIRK